VRAHPAGPLHAEVLHEQRLGVPPADLNALTPHVWPRHTTRGGAGAVTLGAVDVREIAARFGTPAFVIDEADFRARARAHVEAFAGADVYYAGKALLCTAVAGWVAEEGLSLDVCTGGELAVAQHAGFPADRIAFHATVNRR